jgi:hypothetical protein
MNDERANAPALPALSEQGQVIIKCQVAAMSKLVEELIDAAHIGG